MSGKSEKQAGITWSWVMNQAGWATVAEMARASNVSYSACYDYVYNGRIPALDAAFRIAKAAGLPVDEIAKRLVI